MKRIAVFLLMATLALPLAVGCKSKKKSTPVKSSSDPVEKSSKTPEKTPEKTPKKTPEKTPKKTPKKAP